MPPALAQWPRFYSQTASMTHVCFLLSLTYLCCATRVRETQCVFVCVCVFERGEQHMLPENVSVRWQETRSSVTNQYRLELGKMICGLQKVH